MAIPENRMSTSPVPSTYAFPEGEERINYLVDNEAGPRGLNITEFGMNDQHWILSYDQSDGTVTLTPQIQGDPIVYPLLAPFAQQLSFCFDQNARPAICWVTDGTAYLYWYDSNLGTYITDQYDNTISAMLTLDDKRQSQVETNDIIFWYVQEVNTNLYSLYQRTQRQRFLTPYAMANDVPPYLFRAGMAQGHRLQVALTYRPPV
jgi:hypothetical protein